MIKNLCLSLGLCLVGTAIFAQDTISTSESLKEVYIDSKTALPRKNSGKVVTVITAEDLKKTSGQTVQEVINRVAGIEINGARSNDGQNLGYYVRGGRNRQVVIMIDGVQVTDPSSISNDYDLRLVPSESIERIEILKGASSVLYGANASTAVISITTKKASDKKIALTYTTTIGSNQSTEDQDFDVNEYTNFVALNGTLGKFFYNATLNQRYVDGLSATTTVDNANRVEDDFNRHNLRFNLGYNFNENITISQFVSKESFNAEYDNFDFTDADNLSISKNIRTGGHFKWKYKNGEYVFNDNMSFIEREFVSSFPSKSEAEVYTLDNYLNHRFNAKFSGLVGLNVNFSKYRSESIPFGGFDFEESLSDEDANFDIIDPYVNVLYKTDFGLTLNAGARVNIHSVYDTHVVFNVNPSYNVAFGEANVKFLGSYSTAYITPSLFQVFSPQFGNEDLMPEENRTIEGGVEFTTGNLRASALYFNRQSTNFIDFVTVDPENFISQYQNIEDEFATQGVEVEFAATFNRLTVNTNITYTNAENRFSARIPEIKANATLGYNISDKTFTSLSYQYNDEREDNFFNSDTFASEAVTLESYGLLDFYVSHQALKNLKIFAGMNNILNETYFEIYRFQTRGRNARVGVSLQF